MPAARRPAAPSPLPAEPACQGLPLPTPPTHPNPDRTGPEARGSGTRDGGAGSGQRRRVSGRGRGRASREAQAARRREIPKSHAAPAFPPASRMLPRGPQETPALWCVRVVRLTAERSGRGRSGRGRDGPGGDRTVRAGPAPGPMFLRWERGRPAEERVVARPCASESRCPLREGARGTQATPRGADKGVAGPTETGRRAPPACTRGARAGSSEPGVPPSPVPAWWPQIALFYFSTSDLEIVPGLEAV